MRLSYKASFVLGAVILGATYHWLLAQCLSQIWQFSRLGLWLQRTEGVPHGMTAWLVVFHNMAVFIAALPIAIAVLATFPKRAVALAFSAAGGALFYDLTEQIKVWPMVGPMPAYEVAVEIIGYIFSLVAPALLVRHLSRRPPNSFWGRCVHFTGSSYRLAARKLGNRSSESGRWRLTD
jgi:hypothetical protein